MTHTTNESVKPKDDAMAGAIAFEDVSKWFDPLVPVLDDIALSIPAGAFVSIIGPSGCGKSTLLRMAGDLIDPSRGRVLVNGLPAAEARKGHKIGVVFQAPNLCPWRSVRRNVELPLETIGVGRADRRKRAQEQLARVRLGSAAELYPRELSGGMAQRVAIARALVFDPPIVLMDEPFGALDEITRDRLNLELHELWRRNQKTILFVTHSIPEAVLLSTRVVVMSMQPGRIVETIDIALPAERHAQIALTEDFFAHVSAVRSALLRAMGDEV